MFDTALPRPPAGLIITDIRPDAVRLAWNSGNAEPIPSYAVQFRPKHRPSTATSPTGAGGSRREDDDDDEDGKKGEEGRNQFREVADLESTEYLITGLNAFTVYEVRVVAVNGVGRSAPSKTIDVTTAELGFLFIHF